MFSSEIRRLMTLLEDASSSCNSDQTLTEATVKLLDLYDDNELHDPSEALHSYIDKDDITREFTIHEMTSVQAKKCVTHKDNMPVFASFKKFATKSQKQLIQNKVQHYDHDRIIVLINNTVLDGNHHLIAGILANQPIKYIDLAQY